MENIIENSFDWVSDVVVPEISDDTIELFKIMDTFDTFPSNFMNAKHKRISLLKNHMNQILDLKMTEYSSVSIAGDWLSLIYQLVYEAEAYGSDKWYNKHMRKIIREIKHKKIKLQDELINYENMWSSFSPEELAEDWEVIYRS